VAPRRRVAILVHERQRPSSLKNYAIHHLAEFWRAGGIEVEFFAGVERFVPCDLVIVHVDLSVVPMEYLDFARRFPRVINGSVEDIRKSTISRNCLKRGTDYRGPVIVKSDLNYAGRPERFLGGWSSLSWALPLCARVASRHPFATSLDYRLYDDVTRVPHRYFRGRGAVVERFLPELKDGKFHVRTLEFLGDRYTSLRLASYQPIVKEATAIDEQVVPPHPTALAVCRELNIEYGKIDYVIHDGSFHLLDLNKTPGASVASDIVKERRRHRATGIAGFLR
jgi:hypothetical protein